MPRFRMLRSAGFAALCLLGVGMTTGANALPVLSPNDGTIPDYRDFMSVGAFIEPTEVVFQAVFYSDPSIDTANRGTNIYLDFDSSDQTGFTGFGAFPGIGVDFTIQVAFPGLSSGIFSIASGSNSGVFLGTAVVKLGVGGLEVRVDRSILTATTFDFYFEASGHGDPIDIAGPGTPVLGFAPSLEPPLSSVPEPSTLALFGFGLLGLVSIRPQARHRPQFA